MSKARYRAESIILSALFMIYLIVLFKITIFRDRISGAQSFNLIPFTTIAEYLKSAISGIKITGIANLLGNLILFFPLGYVAALLFPKMRKLTRILILVFGFSVAIEIVQYILRCGTADIDDVILNTLGGIAGYGIYALFSRFPKPKKYAVIINALMIAVTYIGFYFFDNYRFLVNHAAPGGYPVRLETLDDSFNDPLTIAEPPPSHFSTDTITNADEAVWSLILVNKWNPIPDDYEVDLTELSNGQSVDIRIYPALQEMFDAARDDGIYPVVVSGYRTAETQQRLMDDKVAEYRALGYSAEEAIASAEAWVAIPGTSEHQLGIAVDINADGIHSAGYEVYEWLEQNAHTFGFICRYPPDKTEITGVINEPWHYRYVGVEAATEIHYQDICLEEYLN